MPLRKRPQLPAGDFDLVLVLCTGPYDLFALRWVEPLLARTKKVAAWMIEFWKPNLAGNALSLEPTRLFDALFVGNAVGHDLLAPVLYPTPLHYLPPAAAANYCRFDQPDLVGDARDVPARIFEGGAAGCIIAGETHRESLERVGIDPAIVVPFGLDGSASVLDATLARIDRLAQPF